MTAQKFKPVLFHILNIIILYLATAVFFGPLYQGKKIASGDSIQSLTNRNEIYEYKKESGKRVYWSNSMFGGMPDVALYGLKYIYPGKVYNSLNSLAPKPANIVFKSMLLAYISFALLGINIWLCLLGGLASGLTTNYLVVTEAGQYAKIACASISPLIMTGVLLSFRKKWLIGGTVLAFASSMALFTRHPQMMYYLFLSLLIGGIAFFVKAVINKELVAFAKTTGVILLAGGIAIMAGLTNLRSMSDYSADSMRGKPILEKSNEVTNSSSSSEVNGLAWDYAMQWSNNRLDLFSTLIPRVVGGSSAETIDSEDASARLFQSVKNARAPLYWGALPFTSGPSYFGIIILLLFIFGLFFLPPYIRWWAIVSVILMLLLSMGKNMEGFNRLFFDYFPLYNKFRTPNSILVVTSGIIIFFAVLGMQGFLDTPATERKKNLKKLYYTVGGLGAVILFFAIMGPSFFDFRSAGDTRYQAEVTNLLVQDRKAMMQSDAWRTLGLLLAGAGLVWAFVQQRLQLLPVLLGLAFLSTIDLWMIGRRYLNEGSFVNAQQYQQNFQARPVDQQIMQQEPQGRGYYRVLDLSINTFNSSSTSYFHNTVGGYSAVKLQRIQDIIDQQISVNNQLVLDMLNTKYVITQQGQLQTNPNTLGNAWFVESIKAVDSPNQEIDALSNFDPSSEAIILSDEFADYLNGFTPGNGEGSIQLTAYAPNKLTYSVNSAQEQLAVFSEIWYGPKKGWKVTLDGEEVDHIRANYILRAMRIPAGQHTIMFEFDPGFIYGKVNLASQLSSGIILLLTLGVLGLYAYKWYQAPAPKPAPAPAKNKPAAKARVANKKKKKRK